MTSLIIVAAGKGTRLGGETNKVLKKAGGRPLIWYTLRHMTESRRIDEIVMVVRREERETFREISRFFADKIPISFADGGASREESVRNGLSVISKKADIVLIHDGARPFVDGGAADRVVEAVKAGAEGAILAIPSADTMKTVSGDIITGTLPRKGLMRAQTPQGFRADLFRRAMETFGGEEGLTDDASLMERAGYQVKVIDGDERYFKVTTPSDWKRMEDMIQDLSPVRIGSGYDIHRFAKDRPLVLGGVTISNTGGLLGHSDADVLIHALMDAILGAAGLPDIGVWFPDTDPRYEGASSLMLLKEVTARVEEKGYVLGNADITVIAEAPKLSPYRETMKKNLASAMHAGEDQIAIKATTNETLGAIGRREGMAAMATVLLYRRN